MSVMLLEGEEVVESDKGPRIIDLTSHMEEIKGTDPVEKLRSEIAKAKTEYNEEVEHLDYYQQMVQTTRDRMHVLLGRINQYETAIEVIKNGKFG